MRKLLFITLALVGNLLFSNEEDVFRDKNKVIRYLKSYMSKVDGKDLSGMYKHLSMPFVLLCFERVSRVSPTSLNYFGSRKQSVAARSVVAILASVNGDATQSSFSRE